MRLTCAVDKASRGSENTNSFSDKTMSMMKDVMYEHSYPKGSSIFWEGEASDKLYFLKSGAVKLTKSTDDGQDLTLYHFQSGDFFGELEGNDLDLTNFNAEAMTDCTVGIIQQSDLETLLWQNGDMAIEFMKWMGYMNRFTQTKLRDLMFYGKQGALASTLIRIANTYGVQKGGKIEFTIKFTNEELANMIGSTRETVNRMLGKLKKDGVISADNGKITINSLPELKKICHCEGCPLDICRL
ncbi:Crp/Fnr family transcriptional regulator [Pseudalkalibacillus caeni]|uniref:Crp/Fnr family transcriptional regulator n=1 Tax=Exobacillus caeni TaxID=2574798 RepID=A0A5R9EXQ4_9BACL|nr:Crp/Fnr family transcriptional regulator [Pseudalkalibacillus caeni]TLS36062.1 Crp/Fnr family transcriptional regulator [Pseudalkalibacillus caeni]